jgi:hypothetical protein
MKLDLYVIELSVGGGVRYCTVHRRTADLVTTNRGPRGRRASLRGGRRRTQQLG